MICCFFLVLNRLIPFGCFNGSCLSGEADRQPEQTGGDIHRAGTSTKSSLFPRSRIYDRMEETKQLIEIVLR